MCGERPEIRDQKLEREEEKGVKLFLRQVEMVFRHELYSIGIGILYRVCHRKGVL